ncbi:hypothetical protein RND71_010997 [Anisodus tanguticus]|uniref:Uncharacterized protein n=1 Tax=Anisodus tanguticus TaxID=243964 RepID=A0AAE1SLD7_9SOLA|nr:hypothetical protein RND71_010997 [Anisodus tanguticus]
MDSSGFFMKEVKSELNKLCIDNEDPKMKLEWKDNHIDQRSKFIIHKLVEKMEEEFALKKKMEEVTLKKNLLLKEGLLALNPQWA